MTPAHLPTWCLRGLVRSHACQSAVRARACNLQAYRCLTSPAHAVPKIEPSCTFQESRLGFTMLLFVAAMNLLYVILIFTSFASLQPLLAAAISAVLLAIQAQEMTSSSASSSTTARRAAAHAHLVARQHGHAPAQGRRALVCEWNGPAHRAAATTCCLPRASARPARP